MGNWQFSWSGNFWNLWMWQPWVYSIYMMRIVCSVVAIEKELVNEWTNLTNLEIRDYCLLVISGHHYDAMRPALNLVKYYYLLQQNYPPILWVMIQDQEDWSNFIVFMYIISEVKIPKNFADLKLNFTERTLKCLFTDLIA